MKPTALYFEAGSCLPRLLILQQIVKYRKVLARTETGTSVFVKLLFLIICH